jgi:hypothetical protein
MNSSIVSFHFQKSPKRGLLRGGENYEWIIRGNNFCFGITLVSWIYEHNNKYSTVTRAEFINVEVWATISLGGVLDKKHQHFVFQSSYICNWEVRI